MLTRISVTNSPFQTNWAEIASRDWSEHLIYTFEQSSSYIYITSGHRKFRLAEKHTNLFLSNFRFNHYIYPWNSLFINGIKFIHTLKNTFMQKLMLRLWRSEVRIQNVNRQVFQRTRIMKTLKKISFAYLTHTHIHTPPHPHPSPHRPTHTQT